MLHVLHSLLVASVLDALGEAVIFGQVVYPLQHVTHMLVNENPHSLPI
jgi:hypothetical protein